MDKLEVVKIKKLREDAIIPTYGSEFSAGADLYALLDKKIEILPRETVMINTGISLEIPKGYAGFIYARSSVASKRGLAPANKVGVIDSDYRGEIMIALHNQSNTVAVVEPKEKVAQLVIAPYLQVNFELANNLAETKRGAGGFGSTGKK